MSRPEEAAHIRAKSFADSSAREKEGQKINTVVATVGSLPERQEEISYSDVKVIGNGSFGVVYQAKLCNTDQLVAIKKVLQEPQESHHNRELQIMRKLDHCNIIQLLYFFKNEVYLYLVLDFVPETMYGVIRQHRRNKQTVPSLCIKLYMYQLFRSLAYIHANGVCHRDITPQNILVNPETGVLKLCDFGSAKVLVKGEPNKSHICSRYYRAPELIFGATDYTVDIDIWSAGCVFAELLLGEPIFRGDSEVDQIVKIIKDLGTPTMEQIRQMNSTYTAWDNFPKVKPRPWNKVFRTPTPPEAIDLVSHLLEYTPSQRIHPLESCAHPFFDELRQPGAKMPNGREFPTLFNFSEQELSVKPSLRAKLMPASFADSSAREKEGQKINTVVARVGSLPERQEEISYSDVKVIGNGSFGVVYQAKLCNTDQLVAIKKVLQEPQESHHNRELQIMRKLDHCNIIQLLYFFKDEVYLYLVLDFVPETMCGVIRHHRKNKQTVPSLCIKLYMYQLFRSLAYIHANGVCHRDITPQNILVNPETGELKLCDFGIAKVLVKGEWNKSHICSRYYRAPELIFGATDYTVDIDIWSAGCIFAELLLGEPIFRGDSQVDQIVKIMKVLGTPTKEQIRQMNSKNTATCDLDLPKIKPRPWNKVFRTPTPPEAIDLVSHLLEYTPSQRIHPLESCAHPFFDELRQPGAKMPNGREFPMLFNFSEQELSSNPSIHAKLMPATMPGASTPSEAVPQTSSNNHCDSGQESSPHKKRMRVDAPYLISY